MKQLHILLREFRKTVIDGKVVNTNIGTTAHGPGILSLFEKYLPECDIRIWASAPLSPEMTKMMSRSFPHISFVYGSLKEPSPELREAVEWSDMLLIGSGSCILENDVEDYIKISGKPYAAAGIGYNEDQFPVMQKGAFMYFRESQALADAEKNEMNVPTGFLPDGAFAFDTPDETAAADFMDLHGLEEGKFVCCLIRNRWTPVWEYCPEAKFDPKRDAYNKSMIEQDFAPLVSAVCRIVREKHLKVLLAPETLPALALSRDIFYNMFPADVKDFLVVPGHYWEADEALGVYRKSLGIFGLEMHSQVIGIGNKIPSIVCRTKEFGSKSDMWKDIGLEEWLFDFDLETDRMRFPDTVLEMLSDPAGSRKKVENANRIIDRAFLQFRDFMREYIVSRHS